jgi:hypothetical protein
MFCLRCDKKVTLLEDEAIRFHEGSLRRWAMLALSTLSLKARWESSHEKALKKALCGSLGLNDLRQAWHNIRTLVAIN